MSGSSRSAQPPPHERRNSHPLPARLTQRYDYQCQYSASVELNPAAVLIIVLFSLAFGAIAVVST